MSQFQLVACQINIGGDRNTVVVRDRFDPVTFPEYLLLQVLHGGEEHVHHAVSVGWTDLDLDREYQRLQEKYGEIIVAQVFPAAGSMRVLPFGNEAMVTQEEWDAGEEAKAAAQAKARAKPKAKPLPPMNFPAGADDVAALDA